jgi:uracil-DNA glycosylase
MKSVEKNLRERSAKELAQIAQATQGVIGEGPAPAAIMLVGEQPGDQEIAPAILLSGPRAASWIAP